MSNFRFDPAAQPPQDDFSPLPSAEYPAMVTESTVKQTKDKRGSYLELTYQVIDGPFKNRKLWARFNFDNQSSEAVRIAKAQLTSLSHACGITHEWGLENDTAPALHDIPHIIRVEYVPASPPKRERDGNEIKGWKALAGGVPAQTSSPFKGTAANANASPATAAAQPAARPAASRPAWAGKPAA